MQCVLIFALILAYFVEYSQTAFTPDRIRKHGYPVESFEVVTEDGYILVMHRIPGKGYTRLPVLIQHGIIGSSDHFVVTGPKQGLIFQLHDDGYDVWLPNTRGNTYTKKHKFLSPSSQQFWNYTFHELAVVDLPALIDFVLITTGKKKLHYIGHSQGTTIGVILLAEKPEYNEIIESMTLMAPVVYMGNLREPNFSSVFRFVAFTFIAPELGRMNPDFDRVGSFEVFSYNKEIGNIFKNLCLHNEDLCRHLFKYGGAMGYKHYQQRIIADAFSVFPSSSSVNQFVHYAQLFVSNRFEQCDWGSEYRNMLAYGKPKPPGYKLENIKVPVHIFYSDDDTVVSPTDVKRLMKRLPNVRYAKIIQNEGLQHFDYIWGRFSKKLVNDDILQLLNKS